MLQSLKTLFPSSNCKRASTAWSTLHNHYLDQSLAKELDLKLKLHNLQKGSLSIEAYCKHFKDIFDSLDTISQPISDRVQVMYLLKGLPPTYDSVVTFASNLRPPPTFHDVWNMLLTQEAHLDQLRTTPSDSSITVQPTALLSSQKSPSILAQSSQVHSPRPSSFTPTRGGHNSFGGRYRGRGRGGRGVRFFCQPQFSCPSYGMFNPQSFHPSPSNPTVSSPGILGSSPFAAIQCQLCDQMGHTAKNCSSPSQSFPSTDNSSQFAGFFVNDTFDPTWYLDSGATSHMTNKTGKFKTIFKYTGNDSVSFGNGQTLPILHTGSTSLTTPSSTFQSHNTLDVPSLIKFMFDDLFQTIIVLLPFFLGVFM